MNNKVKLTCFSTHARFEKIDIWKKQQQRIGTGSIFEKKIDTGLVSVIFNIFCFISRKLGGRGGVASNKSYILEM